MQRFSARVLGLRWALWLALVVGCRSAHDAEPATKTAPALATKAAVPSASPPARPIELGPLTAPDAFELVASSEGATLVWAAPGDCDTSLRVQRFDANAQKLGGATRDVGAACGGERAATIRELSAASAAGKLGVAWIAETEHAANVLGTFGPDDADTLAPARSLSAAAFVHEAPRARLTLSAAASGQLRVAFRAPEQRCVDEPGNCAQLVTRSLAAAGERGGDTRELKQACPRMMVGAYAISGTYYDAFCALGDAVSAGEPLTHVYAIRPEISYAEEVPVLAGCEPLGIAPLSPALGVAVWGLCAGALNVTAVVAQNRGPTLEAATRELRCVHGRPQVSLVAATGGRIEVALDTPRDRIELLLPDSIAPSGSRAAFTGSRVFVTNLQRNQLVLRSYVCRGDALVEAPGFL